MNTLTTDVAVADEAPPAPRGEPTADRTPTGMRGAFVVLLLAAIAQGAGIAALLPVFRALERGESGWPALVPLLAIWVAWAALQTTGIILARSRGYARAGELLRAIGTQVTRVPPGALAGPAVGKVSRLAVGDVMHLITRPAHLLDPLLSAAVIPLTTLIVAAFVEPLVGLLGLVLLPVVLAAYVWCGRRVERSDAALHEAGADAATRIVELAEQQPVLRSAGRADDPGGSVAAALREVDRRTRRMLRSAIPGLAGYTVTVQVVTAALVAGIGLAAYDGWIGAAEVLVLAVLVVRAGEQLLHAGEHAGASRLAAAAEKRINDFLDSPRLPEPAAPHPVAGGRQRTGGVAVELRDVSVVHADGTPALRGVDLSIPAGATVAIVGASGAGKSTIAQLLTRMLDPTSGSVRIDGIDTRDLGSAGVARLVAPVFQQTYLFDDTLRANLAIARPDAPDAEIEDAGAIAGLDEVVTRLPDGWSARVGEGGGLLSSGERQRVAIARAVAKRAPLLVLDEFTSVLDAHTEAQVIAAVTREAAEATVVIVTHSPAAIAAADLVVTIADGRVAAVTPSTAH